MKLLIDKQLSGCGILLKSVGYEVVSVEDIGLKEDEDIVEYASKNGLFIITEDNRMAKTCEFRNIPYLHLSVTLKTKVIEEELKKRIKQ